MNPRHGPAPQADILARIAGRRRERLMREGHALGVALPERREVPLVAFAPPERRAQPFLICEVKRRSPSRGQIAVDLDAARQAEAYVQRGVRHLSVLTEEDHFAGSLADLVAVKRRFPQAAVLRKDFLLDERDLEVSWRAGADAVLLIAALLPAEDLPRLCRHAAALGLAALVELHAPTDLDRVRESRPPLTGINSRDLRSFRVDPLAALALRRKLDWPTCSVYESGIRCPEDVLIARAAGFAGFLVGEAVVRRPALVGELQAALGRRPAAGRAGDFWGRLSALAAAAHRSGRRGAVCRPLVKVCGLTRARDAELAAELGADLLGFVFAPSPRRAQVGLLRELRGLQALKVAVVVSEPQGVPDEVRELLAEGLVDAVQLHGEESPEECLRLAFPYYKALRIRGPADVEAAGEYRCPRVLADAWSTRARGGTGQRIPQRLVRAMAERGPLWLAGGIGPDNAAGIVRRLRPELIDASSRLESSPGLKDPDLIRRLFDRIRVAEEDAQ